MLMVFLTCPALAAEIKAGSNTNQASCVIKIDADPAVYPVSDNAFETLIGSSGVGLKAYRDVFKSECNDLGDMLQVKFLGSSSYSSIPLPMSSPTRPTTTTRAPTSPSSRILPTTKPAMDGMAEEYEDMSMLGEPGMGARPTSPASRRPMARTTSSTRQMFKLEVDLRRDNLKIEPLAEEFLAAVIENLKASLMDVFDGQQNLLQTPLQLAEKELNNATYEFESISGDSPASKAIKKQLDMTVDVSKLKDNMPVSEAFDVLSKSVNPPLPITVMWKDLSENAFIDKEEPIGIDGKNMSAVRLSTALDLVLKSVGAGLAELGYAIDGGILIVATRDTLPATVPVESLAHLKILRTDLASKMAQNELQIAEQEAYRQGIVIQIANISAKQQNTIKNDAISAKYEYITKLRTEALEAAKRLMKAGTATEADVKKAEEELVRTQIDYAQRQQEVSDNAGGNKISQLNDRLGEIEVDVSVKKSRHAAVQKQLNEIDAKLAAAVKYESKRYAVEEAKQALANAEYEVKELQKQLADLKMPIVTVIGAK